MKPGWQTTEFWIALATQALALAVLLGHLSPTDARSLEGLLAQLVEHVAGLMAAAIVAWKYIAERTSLKRIVPSPIVH